MRKRWIGLISLVVFLGIAALWRGGRTETHSSSGRNGADKSAEETFKVESALVDPSSVPETPPRKVEQVATKSPESTLQKVHHAQVLDRWGNPVEKAGVVVYHEVIRNRERHLFAIRVEQSDAQGMVEFTIPENLQVHLYAHKKGIGHHFGTPVMNEPLKLLNLVEGPPLRVDCSQSGRGLPGAHVSVTPEVTLPGKDGKSSFVQLPNWYATADESGQCCFEGLSSLGRFEVRFSIRATWREYSLVRSIGEFPTSPVRFEFDNLEH